MLKRNFKENIESEIFHAISNCCDKTKTECYVIGGFVRDIIIGKRLVKDIDILVVGSGIDIAKLTARKLKVKSKITVFKNFGTAMFRYNGYDIEFVGTRKESYNKSSRNPVVSPGTLDDDLNRRDFTINALGISLNRKSWGDLLDKFNGITDLENKILKTPLEPRQTFSDDPLRMLRAARFSSQLNFKIDINSFKGLIAEKERIKIISPERISEEINKIIMTSKPSIGFKILESTGLLKIIIPELTEETRKDLIKVAKSEAENSKVSIRNQRRDANGMLKEFCNEKEISQDDLRRGEEIIQKLTDEFIEKIDVLLDKKEKDLLEI